MIKTLFVRFSIMLSLSLSVISASGQALSALEKELLAAGMVDVTEQLPDIQVRLMYATADNFTGKILYKGLDRAFLHPDAVKALAKANDKLHETHPEYQLLIKDAARPMSVQKRMFDAVKGTPKAHYVANPVKGGGLHNYGLAVDITIVDAEGNELPMGTPVDHLGPEANIDREMNLVKLGIITEAERQNRLLLRNVMTDGGFSPLRTEWWHFNLVTKSQAASKFKRLNF